MLSLLAILFLGHGLDMRERCVTLNLEVSAASDIEK